MGNRPESLIQTEEEEEDLPYVHFKIHRFQMNSYVEDFTTAFTVV
jgi:hypothetical protein